MRQSEIQFAVYGPYPIPLGERGAIVDDNPFWNEIVNDDKLANACGCYIFAAQTSGAPHPLPWYVGMTKRTFKKEVLHGVNMTKFTKILQNWYKITPYLFLLPRLKPQGGFSTDKRRITDLEKVLIGLAYQQNPDIINKSDTKIWRSTEIVGIMNTSVSRAPRAAMRLRETLGVKEAIGKPFGT